MEDSIKTNLQTAIEVLTKQFFELKVVSASHIDFLEKAKPILSDDELRHFDDITVRHNHHTLITISSLNLLSILNLYNETTLLWERIMLINKAHLVIYESISEIEKRRKKLLDILTEHGEADNELFDALKTDIKKFKKEFNFKQIGEVRNKVSGHIDQDFENYFNVLNNIAPVKAMNAITTFVAILNRYDEFLNNLRLKINERVNQQTLKMEQEMAVQKEKLKSMIAELKLQMGN